MNKYFRKLFGLEKQSDFVKKYLEERNIRSAVLMTIIVIILEIWMIISLGLTVMESAAAGKPRDFIWILNHGGWYVALLGAAIAVLVYALKYLRGKTYNLKRGRILLTIFSVVALVFGIHFGNNSYVHGDQAFAFVTMTLFVFGLLVWKPVAALVGSVVTFGGFYLLANSGVPANYGMQVNLFTLWISTFVVSLISYQQVITAARKSEQREEANAQLQKIADFDALTGIPSMHSFNRAVGVLFEGITEFNVDFSILYMDIEHFKAYNDKNGFGAGDKLLCDMAAGLIDVFKNELVARYSDDHFVALCETCVSEERALAANEVLKSLRGDVRL
ncbi:MAG: GGDEF domain-containing protein, partial [Coriobacteriales bacterium]|nr:GGDEF domain-containing protein [Coriobacteriales bacterium]